GARGAPRPPPARPGARPPAPPPPPPAAALALTYATGATALIRYGKGRLRRARAASREVLEVSRDAVARTADELARG
ncbi:hypothetical protein AB0N23_29965, partial [Streptomyces sp. NPDC052644]